MPSLRSGLTIRASEPKHSEQMNSPSEQLLDDSMTGEQFNHETVTTQPEKGNKSLTGDTGVEQGSAIMIMDEEAEQTTKPDVAIVIIDEDTEQTIKTDSVIEIIDDGTEQTTKPRRYSPRNAAKRSFKDFVVNDSLWIGQISEVMELTDYILATSEKVVKRAKIIKNQLIESGKYIRDCGGEEMKVTDCLEKL